MRDVDNRSGHATNHYDTSWCLSLHKVLRHCHSVQVGTVNVHSPQLLYAIMRVGDGIVVLGEASRCNEVVDLAMLLQDLGKGLVDRGGT